MFEPFHEAINYLCWWGEDNEKASPEAWNDCDS